jgi:PAS domain S-box-containing protein
MKFHNTSKQIFYPSIHQKEMLIAWKKFIESGEIQKEIVPSHIAESWRRCQEKNVDAFHFSPDAYLDPQLYEKRVADHEYLICIASPFMEEIYNSLEKSYYLVLLYDSEGYHLLRMGRRDELDRIDQSSSHSIRKGLCYEEEKVGTCGFSLVKGLKRPIQITGYEHYSALFHCVVGSYAPINDPMKGNLIGVFGIAGMYTMPNYHTLGIAIAASKAIENYIKLDHSRRVLMVYGRALQMTMDSLDEGIILVDSGGKIYEANNLIKKIFGIEGEEVRGKYLSEIICLPDLENFVRNALRYQNEEVRETETKIKDQIYLTSIQFAQGEKNETRGVIVKLKNIKNLSRIVHNWTGDHPQFTFDVMVGSSPKSLEIKSLARTAAKSDASIIIEGESGTGKEVLAQAIHNSSPRAKQPFVVVNCAAIPLELMESTLFGHEKGAFTSACRTHIGKFELANQGTVFLDEIIELPTNMQSKLLRVLEEKRVERIGGEKPIGVDIRVIAATNRGLTKEIKENRFRRDLFYRLNVFRIILPPLRERKQEIFEYVPFFVHEMSLFLNKRVEKISDDYYEILLNYDWPGNIRELKNAVKFSLTILDSPILSKRHLIAFFNNISQEIKEEYQYSFPGDCGIASITDLEKTAIQKALLITNGNRDKAAKILGIGRATIYRKLQKLDQVSK